MGSAVRIAANRAARGTLEARKQGRPPGQGKLAPHIGFPVEIVEAVPDITLPELAGALLDAHGVEVHPAPISRVLTRADLSYKKKALHASERERADVRAARKAWIGRRQPRMRRGPHRLVFVDECGTKTNMTRARGRARRGTRVRDHAPFRHKGSQNFIAGLRHDRLAAPWVLDGPINRAAFELWVETSSHRCFSRATSSSSTTSPSIAAPGPKPPCASAAPGSCRPIPLDLNPIEMAFANLRRIGARILDTLWRAIGEVCALYQPDECRNYLQEAGYISDQTQDAGNGRFQNSTG